MTKKIETNRKLVLNKSTLRTLSNGELQRVGGGKVSKDAGPGACDGATEVDCPSDNLVCKVLSWLHANC